MSASHDPVALAELHFDLGNERAGSNYASLLNEARDDVHSEAESLDWWEDYFGELGLHGDAHKALAQAAYAARFNHTGVAAFVEKAVYEILEGLAEETAQKWEMQP